MGRLKHRLSFYAITTSAYISPLLMILSLATSHWLYSTEKLSQQYIKASVATTSASMVISATSRKTPIFNSNSHQNANSSGIGVVVGPTSTTRTKHSDAKTTTGPKPLDYIEAIYGLWEMCKIKDTSGKKFCEYVKHFQGSDSEATVTDTLKKQIGSCLIPILLALTIMIISVVLHTYAYFRKKCHYLFLLSGCLFILAGLASLTGLILFIAAVNGAVDNKLTLSKMKEEAPFDYNYGFSFFFAVLSFLTQELNGICNIYWYVDYYRKYKYDSGEKARSKNSNVFQIPTIKVNDVVTDEVMGARCSANINQPNSKQRKQSSGSSSGAVSIGFFPKTGNRPIDPKTEKIAKQYVTTTGTDENSSLFEKSGAEDDLSRNSSIDSSKKRRPTVNRIHKLNHQLYKLSTRRAKESNSVFASSQETKKTPDSSENNRYKSGLVIVDQPAGSSQANKYSMLKMNSTVGAQQVAATKSIGQPPQPQSQTTSGGLIKSVGFASTPPTARRDDISSSTATCSETNTAGSSTSSSSTSTSSDSSTSSTQTPSSPSLSTTTESSVNQMMPVIVNRKLFQDNLLRLGRNKQVPLDPEENELKSRFYKISETTTKSPKQFTTTKLGPPSHLYHHYQPHYSNSYHHRHHHRYNDQHPHYYISQLHQVNTGALKKGDRMLTQRERQDWFRRAPKLYTQSHETPLYIYKTKSKRGSCHHPSENPYVDSEDLNHPVFGLGLRDQQPYYPNNQQTSNATQWPNLGLSAALNAAEAATYDYQKNFPIVYNEFLPNWTDRSRVYDEAGNRKFGYDKGLSKSLVDQSQSQYWWEPTEMSPVQPHPQFRLNSRRDTFLNQIQTAAKNYSNSPRENADYRPVTKYIIEDEDAYLSMISNGGYVPIFGGSLKRTTSV